jgi:hypothetical protein
MRITTRGSHAAASAAAAGNGNCATLATNCGAFHRRIASSNHDVTSHSSVGNTFASRNAHVARLN